MGLALLRLWNAIETALIATMAGAALLLGTYQIASRYLTPGFSIPGTEEMTVYLVVWAMFLSCSQLVARDGHVRPDLVLRVLPVPARRIVEMINCLIAIAFSAGLAWYGARIVGEAYAFDDRSSGIFSFPMWIYDLAVPVDGGLMVLRYAIRFVEFAWRFDPQRLAHAPAGHE